jgi:hypothetical protein
MHWEAELNFHKIVCKIGDQVKIKLLPHHREPHISLHERKRRKTRSKLFPCSSFSLDRRHATSTTPRSLAAVPDATPSSLHLQVAHQGEWVSLPPPRRAGGRIDARFVDRF